MDLELVDTPDLLIELQKRFDNTLFIGSRIGQVPGQTGTVFRWTGDANACLGLATILQQAVIQVNLATIKLSQNPGDLQT